MPVNDDVPRGAGMRAGEDGRPGGERGVLGEEGFGGPAPAHPQQLHDVVVCILSEYPLRIIVSVCLV